MGKYFLNQFILKLNFSRGWKKNGTFRWGLFLLALMVFGMERMILSSAKSAEASEVIFKKKIIYIDNEKINVEVAESSEEHAQGLMLRPSLPEGHGMFFIFPDEKVRHFWMKNTLIPLSIGFFNSNKTLIDIQEMKLTNLKLDSKQVIYSSSGPSMYALELPRQWFRKHRIKRGARLRF